MIEPMTSLAFSVYSAKGVYALLLGSGISRTSGIPTGWDIVLDLIRRFAKVEGKPCGDDPAAWYKDTYGEEPDYSKLLEALASESANRRELLAGYFEPAPEEHANNQKVPTAAHRAIARLVKGGYIRVIVTTNFDQLLEQALQAEGLVPTVIASPDDIKGAVPLPHASCTVIKVHGDYMDARLKNTPRELEKYDEALDDRLDRILDEYGLIVCGWSADWDVALRHAIERCPNRRYATYWSVFSKLSDAAKALCQKRDARVVAGMGADEFFTKLADKVETLELMDAPHPLSVPMAIAQVKQYLSEDRYRIKLHDLVMGEATRVAESLSTGGGQYRQDRSLPDYETNLELLLAILTTAAYWGRARHRSLWARCFERLVSPIGNRLHTHPQPMDNYPAYYLLYAYGIAAVAGGRLANLGYVLANAMTSGGRETWPVLKHIITSIGRTDVDEAAKLVGEEFDGSTVPASRYLKRQLRTRLREFLPNDMQYEQSFNKFEYLMGLVIADQFQRPHGHNFGAYPGLYLGTQQVLREHFDREIAAHGERWSLLRAGPFDRSLSRLNEVKSGFDQSSASLALRLWFA